MMPGPGKPAPRSNRVTEPTRDSPQRSSSPIWLRLSGSGLELAFITFVFAAAGFAIDRWLQNARPMGSAFGGLIGFTFGMTRFIKLATSISAQQRRIETDKANEEKN